MPSRKAIYNSFINSNFDYIPSVWYFTSPESMNRIQKIQERPYVSRFVFKILYPIMTLYYPNVALVHFEYIH